MVKCVTGKNVYANQELAEEALIHAHTRFDFAKGQGPIAVYRCEDCNYFHLTSRGPMNAKLKESLESGSIDRQKRADEWTSKLNHKK